jgi:hypothetical protein
MRTAKLTVADERLLLAIENCDKSARASVAILNEMNNRLRVIEEIMEVAAEALAKAGAHV